MQFKLIVFSILLIFIFGSLVYSQDGVTKNSADRFADIATQQMVIEQSDFIHVPRPERLIKTRIKSDCGKS